MSFPTATLHIGKVVWTIEPVENMSVFHEDNSDGSNSEPAPDFMLIDHGGRRIVLCGTIDSFMLGEVIYRIMKEHAKPARREK